MLVAFTPSLLLAPPLNRVDLVSGQLHPLVLVVESKRFVALGSPYEHTESICPLGGVAVPVRENLNHAPSIHGQPVYDLSQRHPREQGGRKESVFEHGGNIALLVGPTALVPAT